MRYGSCKCLGLSWLWLWMSREALFLVGEIIPQGEADEGDAMSTSLAITPIQTDTMSTSHDQAESASPSS